jgi:hypothetical protein
VTELDTLAQQWLEERRAESGSAAWHRVLTLSQTHPSDAWEILLILMQMAATDVRAADPPSGDALRIHVSSILNGILSYHLTDFIERVESEAASNERFKALLSHVSLPSDAAQPGILARVEAASGHTVNIHPAPGTELARVAYEVADQFRAGKLPGIPSDTRFPVPLLAEELERRVQGHSRAEYSVAASDGLQRSR